MIEGPVKDLAYRLMCAATHRMLINSDDTSYEGITCRDALNEIDLYFYNEYGVLPSAVIINTHDCLPPVRCFQFAEHDLGRTVGNPADFWCKEMARLFSVSRKIVELF